MLTAIDLLELTFTSKPAHPATRALCWKSAANRDDEPRDEGAIPSEAELRYRFALLTDPELARVRDQHRDHMPALLNPAPTETKTTIVDRKASGPVEIASFEC